MPLLLTDTVWKAADMSDYPVPGLYSAVRTSRLEQLLAERLELEPTYAPIPAASLPGVLARHVAVVVRRELGHRSPVQQQEMVNHILELYGTEDDVLVALDELVAVHRPAEFRARRYLRPQTPLAETNLLTNARSELTMGQELQAELASADQVDLICAFIKFAGIRVIKEQLTHLREDGIPIRILTTTYCGVTERRALDMLVRDIGAEVRVCYDELTTRLHAKAWLIKRDSGYHTGYVGSSNLSHSALIDGLEWNVRISAVATPGLITKFAATFETYWNDPSFEHYDPDRDAGRFDAAVRRAAGDATVDLSGLEVHARPHQQMMLEALDAEREVHDRHRNLLVAATGTGKTVVAALDYRRLAEQLGRQPSILFVAHRREILAQSLRTYREVLADGSFGELWVAGERPTAWKHVFASVQTLARANIRDWPHDAFEIVVVDEFHHARAKSYRTLIEHLQPGELLGLTATPERTDGFDVRDLFDGRAAYELRLWDALDQDLLCPFHYYGIADNTDLRRLEWRRGGYAVEDLEGLYTGDDARTRLVISALRDRVADLSAMRALAFCVSVNHAHYMARMFNQAGIASRSITGDTQLEQREDWLRDLREGTVQCIFTVDVFNEGVDLPTLDTILMLRPTESATIFQQQLGRGLRRAATKSVLTVLDFIGQQRREFRFLDRFRALTGATARGVEREMEEGFGFLPSGNRMILDEVARRIILANIRDALRSTRTELVRELRELGDVDLQAFLRGAERRVVDVYRRESSWTQLRRDAGFPTTSGSFEEAGLLRRMWRLCSVDDRERAYFYATLADVNGPSEADLDNRGRRFATMLLGLLWPGWKSLAGIDDGLTRLRANPAVCAEIRDLMEIADDASRHLGVPLGGNLASVPLMSHASYHREEVLIATGWASMDAGGRSPQGHATGVVWVPECNSDVFFVTLTKTEREFSANTMYRDYPISLTKFHWESQNSTAVDSPIGHRYVNHRSLGSNVVLFTRQAREDDLGTAPYLCLGRVFYAEHRGSKPIAITWDLERPMPAEVLTEGGVASA